MTEPHPDSVDRQGTRVRIPEERPRKPKKERSPGVVTAQKPGKKALLHVTVWPEGAGDPWTKDVEVLEDGWFYLDRKQEGPRYRIRAGTVVYEEGKYRATVREGVFETIDVRDLGLGPHPDFIDNYGVEGFMRELADALPKGLTRWQVASAVGYALAIIAVLGVMVWAVISISGELSSIGEGLDRLAQSGNAPGGSGGPSGHQPIAPGGR